jgi:hypothetical protein
MSKEYVKSHDQWLTDYVNNRFEAALNAGNRRAKFAAETLVRSTRYNSSHARAVAMGHAMDWAREAIQDYSNAIAFAAKGLRL